MRSGVEEVLRKLGADIEIATLDVAGGGDELE
jgi:hypothetical protein